MIDKDTKIIQKDLRDGDNGISDTIEIMENFAVEYKNDSRVQAIIRDIDAKLTHTGDDLKYHCERIKNIFNYICSKMTYVSDPDWAELVVSVKHSLFGDMPYGDCDDLSVALATLLLGAGYKTAFKTVAWRKSDPNQPFTHVYVVVLAQPEFWLVLDPTMGTIGYGNEIREITRRKEWVING